MKKFTWDGNKATLVGHLIHEGSGLSFNVKDMNGVETMVSPNSGITVISSIPLLNTETCDEQSMWMAKMANTYKDVSFITMTTDSQKIISEWCNSRNYSNLDIYSDYKRDFGKKTRTLIKKKDVLARGFIIFNGDEIVEVAYDARVEAEPHYNIVQEYL